MLSEIVDLIEMLNDLLFPGSSSSGHLVLTPLINNKVMPLLSELGVEPVGDYDFIEGWLARAEAAMRGNRDTRAFGGTGVMQTPPGQLLACRQWFGGNDPHFRSSSWFVDSYWWNILSLPYSNEVRGHIKATRNRHSKASELIQGLFQHGMFSDGRDFREVHGFSASNDTPPKIKSKGWYVPKVVPETANFAAGQYLHYSNSSLPQYTEHQRPGSKH